jgi:hypothetical protein
VAGIRTQRPVEKVKMRINQKTRILREVGLNPARGTQISLGEGNFIWRQVRKAIPGEPAAADEQYEQSDQAESKSIDRPRGYGL